MSAPLSPANIIVEPFGAVAAATLDPTDPGGVTLPIPRDSQVGVVVGAASFADGMPPATMSDPETEGGVPPFGQDVNGILYMLSAYCAMLQAGQIVTYSEDASDAFTGYAIGARVASASTPGRVWINVLVDNENDPDDDDTGWASLDPLTATMAPAAGTINNLVLPGASDYALDIDTTDGPVDITGLVAQRNGQKVYVSCTGANLLQFLALNAGSDIENRIRAATDLALVENQTLTLQYFTGLDLWLLV